MSFMALLTIVLIILLIALLMLFYRLEPVFRSAKNRSETIPVELSPPPEFSWTASAWTDITDINERRAGDDRRSLPVVVSGQIGGYGDRRCLGRRQQDNLWNR